MALHGCLKHFESYVGISYEESELEVFPLTPTEASWDEIDDREVICAVYLPEGGKLTGSVRDARR